MIIKPYVCVCHAPLSPKPNLGAVPNCLSTSSSTTRVARLMADGDPRGVSPQAASLSTGNRLGLGAREVPSCVDLRRGRSRRTQGFRSLGMLHVTTRRHHS
eukprot:5519233-Prymnesium_polylepis.1